MVYEVTISLASICWCAAYLIIGGTLGYLSHGYAPTPKSFMGRFMHMVLWPLLALITAIVYLRGETPDIGKPDA